MSIVWDVVDAEVSHEGRNWIDRNMLVNQDHLLTVLVGLRMREMEDTG
jgi:hypothetical protein